MLLSFRVCVGVAVFLYNGCFLRETGADVVFGAASFAALLQTSTLVSMERTYLMRSR